MPAAGRLGARRPHCEAGKRAHRFLAASPVRVIRAGDVALSGPVRLADVGHFGQYSPRYRAERGCEVRALSRRAERRPADGMRGRYSGTPWTYLDLTKSH